MLHGICEVVERDCDERFDMLDQGDRALRQIDLRTIRVPFLCDLLDRYANAGIGVKAWDITGSAGIPAYRCVIEDFDSLTAYGTFRGSGCHLSPAIAMGRALTESAQARLTVITGSREDLPVGMYRSAKRRRRAAPGDQLSGCRDFNARENRGTGSVENDLTTVLRFLEAAGSERIIRIDYTDPQYGIPVTHIVVPGMRAIT
jgi:ribosomal protein S12 methylthiotransferase accessory factor